MQSLADHLKDRGVLPMHNVIIDEETRTATFLLRAYGTGKYLGFQTYKPEGPRLLKARDLIDAISSISRMLFRANCHTSVQSPWTFIRSTLSLLKESSMR
jgi:hypothetical protein